MHCRFNLNTIASFAEDQLLSQFQVLTGMHPDCPIPAYMRLDANLFFTNFVSFRGAWPLLAGSASAAEVAPSVAPTASPTVAQTASAGQQGTNSSAAEATSNMGSKLAPAPAACMKVLGE
jgi:hypothetical protein